MALISEGHKNTLLQLLPDNQLLLLQLVSILSRNRQKSAMNADILMICHYLLYSNEW